MPFSTLYYFCFNNSVIIWHGINVAPDGEKNTVSQQHQKIYKYVDMFLCSLIKGAVTGLNLPECGLPCLGKAMLDFKFRLTLYLIFNGSIKSFRNS
jgi:hypothetical protein